MVEIHCANNGNLIITDAGARDNGIAANTVIAAEIGVNDINLERIASLGQCNEKKSRICAAFGNNVKTRSAETEFNGIGCVGAFAAVQIEGCFQCAAVAVVGKAFVCIGIAVNAVFVVINNGRGVVCAFGFPFAVRPAVGHKVLFVKNICGGKEGDGCCFGYIITGENKLCLNGFTLVYALRSVKDGFIGVIKPNMLYGFINSLDAHSFFFNIRKLVAVLYAEIIDERLFGRRIGDLQRTGVIYNRIIVKLPTPITFNLRRSCKVNNIYARVNLFPFGCNICYFVSRSVCKLM